MKKALIVPFLVALILLLGYRGDSRQSEMGKPCLPTAPPAVPTVSTEPTTVPTEPTTVPTEPATVPTEPTVVPTEPTAVPTEPAVPETEPTAPPFQTVTARPGVRTLANFLATAMLPVGQTMYVWGGGWNEADTGAGIEAVTIGVPQRWRSFFLNQNSGYDHHTTRYQIHDGLDCSGYVGWLVYNTMNTESGGEGFVMPSTAMASAFASEGFGSLAEDGFHPGDVVSMENHVWVCLGTCGDGSVVLVHASPPGVSICGTAENGTSQAVELAQRYMKTYFPEWYAKYPNCTRDPKAYLDGAVGVLRWNRETLADPESMGSMDAGQVLEYLLGKA